jgi:transcriptional regulator
MIRKAMIMLLLLGVVMAPNIVGCASGPEFPAGITGMVFEDANSNGIQVKLIKMGEPNCVPCSADCLTIG